MPLPLVIAGAALGLAATGIKKGLDAHDKNSRAKRIVKRAKQEYDEAVSLLENERQLLNDKLEEFATFKLEVMTNEIQKLVNYIKECKNAKSEIDHENITFNKEEIQDLEISVVNSLEIVSGLAKGTASGVLTAVGAYGSVGLLATASTGTAISTLSGVAATNATLAWLGGGALAAGGGGIALGTAVLGGMVAGPAIAIAGFVMDSKAEENLTEAYDFQSEVEKNIEKIHYTIEEYHAVHSYINEITETIMQLKERFNQHVHQLEGGALKKILYFFSLKKLCEDDNFDTVLVLGKHLKELLNIPLMDEDGNRNLNFKQEIERIVIS